MKAFKFTTPLSIESAQAAVREDGIFLAGGIDLLGELKEFLASPETVVNVKSLPDLGQWERGADVWKIGANTTIASLAEDEAVKKLFAGLAEAAGSVGSPQIRNVATVGGNLAQHSRCWYYRHRDVSCLKNGGATCYAREGENRYHSLFTGNPCISPVVSSLAPVFATLDARAIVRRGREEIAMSMAELYEKAWDNPAAHNSLAPGDLILCVEVPVRGRKSAFTEISQKSAFDWALVSCAAAAAVKGGVLTEPRLALGSISPKPWEPEKANAFLEGKSLTEEIAAQAAELALEGATAFEHNGYKIPMAKAAVRRTLMKLVS